MEAFCFSWYLFQSLSKMFFCCGVNCIYMHCVKITAHHITHLTHNSQLLKQTVAPSAGLPDHIISVLVHCCPAHFPLCWSSWLPASLSSAGLGLKLSMLTCLSWHRGVSDVKGHDDNGGRRVRPYWAAAAVQQHRHCQQSMGWRLGQREQLSPPLRALPHQGARRLLHTALKYSITLE